MIHSHSLMLEPQPPAGNLQTEDVDVGAVLRRMDAGRVMGDEELERHIADCRWLMERAHARFLAHDNPADRDEACLWMHRRDEAMRTRRPEFKAALEAEALRRVETN